MKLFSLFLAAILPAFCFAQAEYYTANLNGAQSGCYKSKAIGNAVLTLRQSRLCVNLGYTGLSSDEAASHIHGPAPVGVGSVAGKVSVVVVPFSSHVVSTSSPSDRFSPILFRRLVYSFQWRGEDSSNGRLLHSYLVPEEGLDEGPILLCGAHGCLSER